MKIARKFLAIALCIVLVLLTLTACGKENTNGLTEEQQNAVSALTGTTAGFGKRLKMDYPDVAYTYGKEITFQWSNVREEETITLTLEKNEGGKYVTVFEKSGLTGTSYKYENDLENAEYRVKIEGVSKDGTKREASNTKDGGFLFKNLATAGGASVNAGINYKFDGSISQEVLENYLDRAMSYCLFPDGNPWGGKTLNAELQSEAIRAILDTGVKYVCRASTEWHYSDATEAGHADLEKWLECAHKIDPDIIFEAGIFETVNNAVNNIAIPAHVFEAFGKKVETRNFDYKNIIFKDGTGFAKWGDQSHVPDITREETQMYFYYKACRYIDMGFESLHLGQVNLIGQNDKNNECYTKVINLIRAYAKKNARRHYVLINCHDGDQMFKSSVDGKMLVDFNMFPLRIMTAKDEVDHAVSENNPQRCDFYPGEKLLYGESYYVENDAPYLKHIKGTSPSGWTTNDYPYLLELDNYGNPGDHISKIDRFGYDEISWFANQPGWYRREFLQKTVDKIKALNDNGHFAMPGRRTIYLSSIGSNTMYLMNDAKYADKGFSDEATIKAIYAKLK